MVFNAKECIKQVLVMKMNTLEYAEIALIRGTDSNSILTFKSNVTNYPHPFCGDSARCFVSSTHQALHSSAKQE